MRMKFAAVLALVLCSTGCQSDPQTPVLEPAHPPIEGMARTVDDPQAATGVGDIQPLRSQEPDYVTQAIEVLDDRSDSEVWMVSCPSFTPASSVAITSPGRDAPTGTPWRLDAAQAQALIHHESQEDRVPVVRRYSTELSERDAWLIVDAWSTVVRRARNPKPEYYVFDDGKRMELGSRCFDGTEYRFVGGEFAGRAHSPGPGLARDLVALGERLYWVAASPPEHQAELIAECVRMADALRTKAEAAPW